MRIARVKNKKNLRINHRMTAYCVALTGTTASGKSTAAAYFKSKGACVLSADAYAKALTAKGEAAFEEIKRHFGESILTEDGELNRRALRQRITTDEQARHWLEQCLHPRIRKAIAHDIQEVTSPYCMIEIPLLTQRNDYPYLDRVLLIESDDQTQIDRIIARDNCSSLEARALLLTQPHQDAHRSLADDLVINNQSLKAFKYTLAQLHKRYLQAALSRV